MRVEDMTDEQLLNMSVPPAVETDPAPVVDTPTSVVQNETEDLPQAVADQADTDQNTDADDSQLEEGISPTAETHASEEVPESEDTSEVEDPDPNAASATTEATETDYKTLYEKLMSPLRANGKDIELKSPEELLSLAQQGANYTKNMQNIRHHKKTLMMLERNGLLDESKIGYLIDLSNGDPSAIQKLLKEKNIDPLDVDTRGESTYTDQGNHRLTDDEVAFREHVEEITSTPQGAETISVLNSWDQASKDELWKSPQLMSTIHSHRLNGTYDAVASEVSRRRTVGTLPSNVPFLTAYAQVGEEMLAAQTRQPVTPVATRVATPARAVESNARVAAAAPTRSGSRRATPIINPLTLSDEDFEKTFAKMMGRL